MRLAHSSFVLAAVFAFSGLAFADPVVGYGVFSLSGTVVGIPTGLDFYFATLGDQAAISSLAMPTGAFSGLTVGTMETIQDLTASSLHSTMESWHSPGAPRRRQVFRTDSVSRTSDASRGDVDDGGRRGAPAGVTAGDGELVNALGCEFDALATIRAESAIPRP